MDISYTKLSEDCKHQVKMNLDLRKMRYLRALAGKKLYAQVIIVGDRPGNAAPTDPSYHHTPFYSTKHCSGWLNALLHTKQIYENDLLWLNAYDMHGNAAEYKVLEQQVGPDTTIIALGGNAERWLKKGGFKHAKTTHPQFHKRFKNKEPYDLPELIKKSV